MTTANSPRNVLRDFAALSPEQQLRILQIRRARAHPSDFNAYCFVDPKGAPWIQTTFHKEWLEAMLVHSKIQIEAFRESAKTEQISIGYVLWRLGKNPNLRVKVVSADDDLAKAIIGAAGEHIERNEKLKEVFPGLKPAYKGKWNSSALFVDRSITMKDASLEAHGVLSSGVGGRCDVLIFDDICNFRNTMLQPAMKKIVKQAVERVWMRLATSDAQIVWLNTPWDIDDASAVIRGYDDYHHIRRPIFKKVRYKRTGDVREVSVWPERHPTDILQLEESRRPASFKTQMRLDITGSRGTPYFSREVLLGARDEWSQLGAAEPGHVYVSFWDLGRHVNKKGRNASVCVTLDITDEVAFVRHATAYIDVPYDSPDSQDFTIHNEIEKVSRLYPGETVVEVNNAGEAVVEGLSIVVTPFWTTVKTKLPMMQNLLNVLTRGSIKWESCEELRDMEEQLTNYVIQDDALAQDWVIALAGAALFVGSEGGSGIVI